MSIDLRQFHASFFSESLEGLDATEANLLRLEGGERSPELLNAIFRAVHSIKGAAGSLGFPQIGRFTHEFENVLDDLRKGEFEPDADGIDTMLACVDHVARRQMDDCAVDAIPGFQSRCDFAGGLE